MFKATNFDKNKLRQRCFHDALQKLSQADAFENATGQICLIVLLMIGSCLDN